MRDSADEKPTRHNRLNSQEENFDFDLVEVRVTPDQENLVPSPLEGFVNDAVDNLLVDAPASQEQILEPHITSNSFTLNNPTSLIAPAQDAPEIKANFYVDYFDNRKQPKTPESESVAVTETNQPGNVDDRNQDTMTVEHNAEIPTESLYSDGDEPLDIHAPVDNGAGMAVAILSQFKSKQESINKQQEKLIQEFAQKIKTITAVTYTAVFFGLLALAAATALGVMLLKTKSEVSNLAGTTTALKDNIRNIAKVTPNDLEGTDPAIDQLSQKVDDVIEQLNEVAELQNKATNAEKNSVKLAVNAISAPVPVEKTAVTIKTASVSSAITEKNEATTTKLTTTKPLEISVIEKKPTAETTAKTILVSKVVKNTPVEQNAPVVKVMTATSENNSKMTNKADSSAPKKVSDIPDKAIQVPSNDINKVVSVATPNTASPQAINTANTKPQVTSGGWTVNLASSNKLDDAKNTAARFAQKGIPVSISSVTIKNETGYRLQVKGFKTKEEATAYKNKAKDTLKLNSPWVQKP